jgi:hypothetical protein
MKRRGGWRLPMKSLVDPSSNFRFWQILLQKSQGARRLIYRQTTKQATIANQ